MMMRMLGAKFQTFYWSELFSNILLVIYFFFALLLPFPAAAMYEWMVFIELWSLYFLVKIQAILAQVVQQLTQTVCMFPPWLSNFLAWLDRHNNIVEQKTYQKKKTYKCTNVINVFSSTIWNNSKAMEMFSQIINTRLIWTSSSSNYSLIRCPYLVLREDDQMINSHPSTTLIHFFFLDHVYRFERSVSQRWSHVAVNLDHLLSCRTMKIKHFRIRNNKIYRNSQSIN